MATRVQVNPLEKPKEVRPVAGPVPRFGISEQPKQVIGPNKAQQLAQALSGIQPGLISFLQVNDQQYEQEQKDKAVALRTKLATTYQEAIKSGQIEPHQSPFFVRAWKESDGRVAAQKYNEDLIKELTVGQFASSVDPDESDAMFKQFRQTWMQDHGIDTSDPAFLDGFVPLANAHEVNARTHQAAAIGDRVVARSKQNLFFEIQGQLDELRTRDLPPAVAAEGINLFKNRGIFVGMDPKEVNGIILEAVAQKALERGDAAIFDVLNHVKTGAGVLGRTKEATALREQVTSTISSNLQAADHYAAWKESQDREKKLNELSSSVMQKIFQNRSSGVPTSFTAVQAEMKAIAETPGGDRLFEAMQTSLANSGNFVTQDKEDDKVKLHFEEELWLNGRLDRAAVIKAMNTGLISDRTAHELINDHQSQIDKAEERRRARAAEARAVTSWNQSQEDRREALNPLERIFGLEAIDTAFKQEGNQAFDANKAIRQSYAKVLFRKDMAQWSEANPKATSKEYLDEINNRARFYIDNMLQSIGSFSRLGAPSADVINNTPGVKAGAIPPVKDATPLSLLNNVGPNAQEKGKAVKHFGNDEDWKTALQEWQKDRSVNSRLGKLLSQQGISTEDAPEWLRGQSVWYNNQK
jgi:hypothetical protein